MSQSQPSAYFALSARDTKAAPFMLALVASGLGYGCRCSGDEPEAATTQAEALAACRAACAAYVGAKCPAPPATETQDECVLGCLEASGLSSVAGCRSARISFLDCVGRSSVDCAAVLSSPSVALELGEGVPACAELQSALARCDAPCRHVGSVHLGEADVSGKRVSGELVRAGCADCSKELAGGAPTGAPCQTARVCAQHCCGCSGSPAHYRARACVAGACADREGACALAPVAAQHDACERQLR